MKKFKKFVSSKELPEIYKHKIVFGGIEMSTSKIKASCQWIDTNINGKWTILIVDHRSQCDRPGICFELEEDAVLFSLSWL